jgi:hypothetical protein
MYQIIIQRSTMNLNTLSVPCDEDGPRNFSVKSGNVECVFRNVKQRLIELIHSYAGKYVVGCVAWLTDPEILEALKQTRCSIIVQKEDFLRPDNGGPVSWLRQKYDQLDKLCWWPAEGGELGLMSDDYNTNSIPEGGAIRCVGNHNRDKSPAFPRMHNKFIVFCNDVTNPNWKCSCAEFSDDTCSEDESTDDDEHWYGCSKSKDMFVAESVWTGSLNLTINAGYSLENAVHIKDPIVATAYLKEWSQILGLSEPLDWTDDWVSPEFRVGS